MKTKAGRLLSKTVCWRVNALAADWAAFAAARLSERRGRSRESVSRGREGRAETGKRGAVLQKHRMLTEFSLSGAVQIAIDTNDDHAESVTTPGVASQLQLI